MHIQIPIRLHKAQREIFSCPRRFRVVVSGRRFGKTALVLSEMLIRALTYPAKVDPRFPVYVLGALPTANQARVVLWRPLVSICDNPDYRYLIKSINRTSMEITLVNNVVIRIAGTNDNNGDRLRGLKIYFACLDEMQDIRPAAFYEVIRPAMSDTIGSRVLFTGTPKGRQNVLYDLYNTSSPDWQSFNYPTWSNPTIPRDEIEQARVSLPPRLFTQEYEASFVDFPGKIYSELDNNNKYFGELPRFDLVVMGVDFGDLHPSLNILGRSGGCWYYLEGWSPNSNPRDAQPIPDPVLHSHIHRLARKWSVSHIYCDPSRPSSILAIRHLGYPNVVAGYNPVWEGITQVHKLISTKMLLFTSGHADRVQGSLDGLGAYQLVEAYHRVQDRDGNYTDQVADGFFSHTCDGIRYALATRLG